MAEKMRGGDSPRYSFGEEIVNSISHGLGIVLSIAGLGFLTAFSALYGNVWHIISCSIFAATLILAYTASTLYHSIQQTKVKHILRIIDHSAIFFLIAGTYTPFTLVSLHGPLGWTLFAFIWILALLGVIFQFLLIHRFRFFSLLVYLAMGWAVIPVIKPLSQAVEPGGLFLLLLGGLAYSLGVPFYIWRNLPYHHGIWHLFVLTGSIFHFFAVLFFVIPRQ